MTYTITVKLSQNPGKVTATSTNGNYPHNNTPLHQHTRALAQRDPRRWPARDRRPVGRLGHLEVIDASDVLNDAVATVACPPQCIDIAVGSKK
jgi:hypothetical protein